MSYATIEYAQSLYGEVYVLTSVDRDDNGQPDYSALTKALASASSLIDSYLGARYDTPVSPVPDIVKEKAVDIAIYRCSFGAGGGLTDEKRQRYEDAVSWLKDVAAGKATVGIDSSDLSVPEQLPEVSGGDRLFTRTTMGDL